MKKYEREIRDLLEKLETFVPEAPPASEKERNREREPEPAARKRSVGVMPAQPIPIRPRRSVFVRLNQWLTAHRVSPALQLMLFGLGLVIIAMIIWQYSPVDARSGQKSLVWLAQLIGGLGGFVFLTPVFVRFFKGKDIDNTSPQYWRGQETGEGFTWSNVRSWFGRRRKNNPPRNDPWNDRNRNNRR